MNRTLTRYESERLEQILNNWVASKLGASLSGFASTSAYDDQIDARTENFETRYPILQEQADQVDAVVYGRDATQFLPTIQPMRAAWRMPLELFYLQLWPQEDIARRMRIARRTVSDRLQAARFEVWQAVIKKRDSATTRASA